MSDAGVATLKSTTDRGGINGAAIEATKSGDERLEPSFLGDCQRIAWVRRGKDVRSALVSELGGVEAVTAQERLLIRKIAVLETE